MCEKETVAQREFGPQVAEALKRRLADLDAAPSIDDVAEVTQLGEAMTIALPKQHQILLVANHNCNPTTRAGKLEWSKVRRVKVMAINKKKPS